MKNVKEKSVRPQCDYRKAHYFFFNKIHPTSKASFMDVHPVQSDRVSCLEGPSWGFNVLCLGLNVLDWLCWNSPKLWSITTATSVWGTVWVGWQRPVYYLHRFPWTPSCLADRGQSITSITFPEPHCVFGWRNSSAFSGWLHEVSLPIPSRYQVRPRAGTCLQ